MNVVSLFKQEIRTAARRQVGTSYYMVVISYEGPGRLANQSHTFSAFVQANKRGIQQWTSLAWLPRDYPASRKICVFKDLADALKQELLGSDCKPVAGRNYSTEATLQLAQGTGKNLAMWGPYQISREFYDAGLFRASLLDRGRFKYHADDRRTRESGEAVNCLHAVSDVFAPVSRSLKSGYGFWGYNGTKKVMNYFSKFGAGYVFDPIDPHKYREINNY